MSVIADHWNVVRTALADEKVRAKGLLRVEEVSFLPAALEIIERPVSPTARATTWALLILMMVAIAWLMLGRVDVVASAQGRVIPADNVKLIQPAEAGVVRAILVRDGQRVRKGQPLIELDPTVSTADAVQAERALETAELDIARARDLVIARRARLHLRCTSRHIPHHRQQPSGAGPRSIGGHTGDRGNPSSRSASRSVRPRRGECAGGQTHRDATAAG